MFGYQRLQQVVFSQVVVVSAAVAVVWLQSEVCGLGSAVAFRCVNVMCCAAVWYAGLSNKAGSAMCCGYSKLCDCSISGCAVCC